MTRTGQPSELPAPADVFITDGYAPAVMQQQLLRFWLRHGRPSSVPLLPTGAAIIHPAGHLMVTRPGGVAEQLSGYTISGLIWGGECLWLDAQQRLVALVSTDAEFDHFEAIREDLEPSLAVFIARAAEHNLTALAQLASTARQPPAPRLAIIGATLIDGRGGSPVPDAVVLLEQGRIAAAGPRIAVSVPPGTPVLDARGKWLLPGLWDMHAHYEQVEWGPIYLASGVTTVRDCGNEFDFITAVRDALRSGRGIGPEILLAGLVDGTGPRTLGAITADTPDEARAVIARYKAAGALQIKIYSSIKPSLVPFIAAETHRLGMTLTGHVPTGMKATEAVEAGMDQISHAHYPAQELAGRERGRGRPEALHLDLSSARSRHILDVFREHHTVFDPTLALFELELHPAQTPMSTLDPGVTHVAPSLRFGLEHSGSGPQEEAFNSSVLAALQQTVRTLHQAGLAIVAGTDQAIPGYSLHRELELYVQAGFTPMEAIQSATLVPARVLGLDQTVGTVEPGRQADLLLLDADPLADIHNTRRVWRTIAAGAVYTPGPLWRSVDFTP